MRWSCEELRMLPVECVVRGYLAGSGWKDYQATGAVCGIPLPEGCSESEQLPEPIFTPVDQGRRRATTRTSTSSRAAELVGRRRLMRPRCATRLSSSTASPPTTRARAASSSPTPSSSSGSTGRRADPRRRGPHAGLVALLAGRRLRARPASRASTSSTCATGPRRTAGTSSRPPPRSPRRSSSGPAARYVEAYERITGEPFEAWLRRSAAA